MVGPQISTFHATRWHLHSFPSGALSKGTPADDLPSLKARLVCNVQRAEAALFYSNPAARRSLRSLSSYGHLTLPWPKRHPRVAFREKVGQSSPPIRAYSDDQAQPQEDKVAVESQTAKGELATALNVGDSPSGDVIVTALHEHAERLRVALVEQESLTKGPWFAQKWLGIDKNAWMRSVGYQASTHSILRTNFV